MEFYTGEISLSIADLGNIIVPSDIEAKAVEEIRKLYPGRRLLIESVRMTIPVCGTMTVRYSMWDLENGRIV